MLNFIPGSTESGSVIAFESAIPMMIASVTASSGTKAFSHSFKKYAAIDIATTSTSPCIVFFKIHPVNS